MDNKEAIRVLKSISVNLGRIGGKIAYVEALQMAIEALKAQDVTDTNVGDTVYRQAAIDALIKADYEFTGILSEPRARRFEQTINALPSVQSEIIRCKDCKHWTRTFGDDRWSDGDCDVFDKHLVMCEGYCAWAERRTDETD